jgi:hypothetical protein
MLSEWHNITTKKHIQCPFVISSTYVDASCEYIAPDLV